jgi:hypothetical protein
VVLDNVAGDRDPLAGPEVTMRKLTPLLRRLGKKWPLGSVSSQA